MDRVEILPIGDPHFKASNVEETQILHSSTEKLLREFRPEFTVVLGDTLDTHDKISMGPLCRAINFLSMIVDYSKLILLIGNHDRRNNSIFMTEEHPFNALKRWPRTQVIDQTQVFTSDSGLKFLAVPYVPPGRLHEALEGYDLSQFRAVFAHQEMRNVRMGSVISTAGDPWPSDFPLIVTGHIHDPQILAPNLVNLGTPFQQSWGDAPSRGIGLLRFPLASPEIPPTQDPNSSEINLKGGTLEYFPLPIQAKVTREILIRDLPQFIPPTDVRLKLKVEGTPTEVASFYSGPWPELLAQHGIKVQVILTNPVKPNLAWSGVQVRPSFLSRLAEMAMNDQELRELFEGLFGKEGTQ